MAQVNSKKLTEDKLKNSFRSKLLEVCRTRTKTSNPYMFIFHVIVDCRGMILDAGRTTTCTENTKPMITNRSTKKGPFENMGFNGKTVWRFLSGKKNRNEILDLLKKTQRNTHPLNTTIKKWLDNQAKIYWRKIEKSIQIGTAGNLQNYD